MKMAIKKVHDDEWHLIVGPVALRMNHFSLELVNVLLKNTLTGDDNANVDPVMKGYYSILKQLQNLRLQDLQRLLQEVNTNDILTLASGVPDDELVQTLIKNVGPLISRQIEQDLKNGIHPSDEQVKKAIQQIMTKTYQMEQSGELEFISEETEYL